MFPTGYANFVHEFGREKTFIKEVNVGLSLLESVLADTLYGRYRLRLPRRDFFVDRLKKEMSVTTSLMLKEGKSYVSYRRLYLYDQNEFDKKVELIEGAIWKEYKMRLPFASDTIEKIILPSKVFTEKVVFNLRHAPITISGQNNERENYLVHLGRKEIEEIEQIYRKRYEKPLSGRRKKILVSNLDYRIDKFLGTMGINLSRRIDRNIEKIYTFFLDSVLKKNLLHQSHSQLY